MVLVTIIIIKDYLNEICMHACMQKLHVINVIIAYIFLVLFDFRELSMSQTQ